MTDYGIVQLLFCQSLIAFLADNDLNLLHVA